MAKRSLTEEVRETFRQNARNATEKAATDSRKRKQKKKHDLSYYERNREEIRKKKAACYQSNPAYREAAKKRSAERWAAYREAVKETHKACPPVRQKNSQIKYCPICHRPLPRPRQPKLMLVAKRYEVMMYAVGDLAVRLKRSPTTLIQWIRRGVIPKTQYRAAKSGRRLWTQDQLEAILRAADGFDLNPPTSFFKCGFANEIRRQLDELKPIGIDTKLYTEPGNSSSSSLRRKDQGFPVPENAGGRKDASKGERGSRITADTPSDKRGASMSPAPGNAAKTA